MSGNENGKSKSYISPLFNHLIMEKIMSYMSHSEWKRLRLVCSFWNEILLDTYLNKKSKIYLEDLSLQQFLQILEQCSKCQLVNPGYENYKIIINSSMSTANNMHNLWNELGEKMKNLSMEITTLYAERQLQDILLEKTNSLETLKIIVSKYWGSFVPESKLPIQKTHNQQHLLSSENTAIKPNFNLTSFSYSYLGSVSLYGETQGDDTFHFPIPSKIFFKKFPKLKKMSLVGLSPSELSDFISGLRYLQTKNETHLEVLEILDENTCPEAPSNDHLDALKNLHLPLTELHLEISFLLSTNLLNNFLSSIATTLKILRLRRFPLSYQLEPLTLKLPMHGVTFLEISNDLVESLEFLPFFPSLETLHVILRDYRNLPPCDIIENTPLSIGHYKNIQNVYIEPPLLSEDCITNLGKLFPNLKRLKIRMDDEMVWTLCGSQLVSNVLEELHVISWNGLTDEGFTGIPQSALRNYLRVPDIQQYRIYPYIGDLRNLKTLTVEMWRDMHNHISDVSVYYGFMELVNLKKFVAIRTSINPVALNVMNVAECTIED